PYLDPHWHAEFDEWLAGVRMPWVDVNDTSNWDSQVRLGAMDADGVSAEIIFPNTLPPFFDILAHLTGVPRDRATFERKWAGLQAHNRWLVEFSRLLPMRRKGIVQLLPNDIEVAVAEVRWAASTGVVAELAHMTLRLRNVQSKYAGDPRALNYALTFGSEVVDGLSLTPVEYFRRNCSIGASMLPRHEVRYTEVLGIDRIMWGTDSP